MKKRGLSIGLSIFFLLSGCSQNSAQNSARAVISESVFEVPEKDVVGAAVQLTENIRGQELFSETALEEASENGEISGFINAMEKLSVMGGGMLYDFDFDNIPEIVAFDYGMEDTFYSIYKYSGGGFLNLGEMKSCDKCLFLNDLAHVDLYHDNKSGGFFYCASSVDFVKNNGEDAGVYGFNGGNLYRYEFTGNEMTKSVMVSFVENSDDEGALEAYLRGCENALSQFEMIGSAVFEPLWTSADIRDGTYRDIVRYELENRYGLGGSTDEKNDGLYINTPVIFSAYCFDEKYPELADKSLVLEMTEGTYDRGRENYDGIWQGDFRFRLTDSGMNSHYEALDSDILSCPMNLSFNGRFELTVNDHNDNGYPDFAVNQWNSLSGGTDCYLFTVKENGTVKSMDIKAGDRESPSLWLPKDYRGIYSPDLIMEGGNCFGVSFFTSGGVTENDIPLIPGGVIDEWFAEHEDRAVSEFTLKNIYMCEGESVTLKEQQILENDGSIWYTSCETRYGEGIEKIFEIIDRTGSSGFLYDFDMDGVPEAAVKFWGVNIDYYYEIYDCGSGMLMGTVSLGAYEEDWLVSPQLTKYYDKDGDRYFYAADRDFWHKGYHSATAERYEFENDSITSTVIAQCKFDYTVGSGELKFTENELLGNKTTPMGIWKIDDIDCYYDGAAEYLAGFEKISVVDETPLWNEGQARSGEYKEIIARELGKGSEN